MLWQRLIFGPVLIAVLIAMLYLDHWLERLDVSGTAIQPLLGGAAHPPAGLAILALLIVAIALVSRELAQMIRAKGIAADAWTLAAAGAAGLVSVYVVPQALSGPPAIAALATVPGVVLLLALVRYTRAGRTQGVMAAAALTLFAVVYLGTLPGFYLLLRLEHAVGVAAAAVLIVKSCDIGAYFTGRAIGRHKLIPWLSPGKTWEGLAGGLGLAAALAVALAAANNHFEWAGQWVGEGGGRAFEPMRYSLAWAAVAGVVLGGVGQLGDLIASLLKRDAGVKDSGRSIPGFGGVLDVMDSLILTAPVAYWLARVALV